MKHLLLTPTKSNRALGLILWPTLLSVGLMEGSILAQSTPTQIGNKPVETPVAAPAKNGVTLKKADYVLAKTYEVRKSSDRIGYVHFLNTDAELRTRTLEAVRRIFLPTSIEEIANMDTLSTSGVRYFLGAGGVTQIVFNYQGMNRDFQERTVKMLRKDLAFDLIYRGNLMTHYWSEGVSGADLSQKAELPLSLMVGAERLSFRHNLVRWDAYKNTKGINLIYRGYPGDIIEMSEAHKVADKMGETPTDQMIGEELPGVHFTRNNTIFAISGLNLQAQQLKAVFEKSDADCAFQGESTEYLYCTSSFDAFNTMRRYQRSMGVRPWRGQFSFEYKNGRSEVFLETRDVAQKVFFPLVQRTQPIFSYAGNRYLYQTRYALPPSGTDPETSGLLDLKVEFFRKDQKIGYVTFAGVDEFTRSETIQFLRETLMPEFMQYVQNEKIMGIYYDTEKTWLEKILPRYSNKAALTYRGGMTFGTLDYTASSAGSWNRKDEAYNSLDASVDWFPGRGMWGMDGRVSTSPITRSGVNGLILDLRTRGFWRYFFEESPLSPELRLGLGMQYDTDRIFDSAANAKTVSHLGLPLMVSYDAQLPFIKKEGFRVGLETGWSPMLKVSNASVTDASGSRLDFVARGRYQFFESPWAMTANVNWYKYNLSINSTDFSRAYLGTSFGVELRME